MAQDARGTLHKMMYIANLLLGSGLYNTCRTQSHGSIEEEWPIETMTKRKTSDKYVLSIN